MEPGGTIVIKPNLTANAPSSSGGTTHVELVEALVVAARAWRPARIVVAEGTAAFGPTHESAFPDGGWREMAARQGVELYNLEAGEHVPVRLDRPRYPHPLPISRLVLEADLFITVPLLKTHVSADYTVALKNSFALTPQATRTEVHRRYLLEEALVDINRMRAPDLVIVDGWDGAEGIAGGTDFRRPAGARVMLAGNDAVAVDVISRELMGLQMRTRYLEWAIEDGVGCGDLHALTVLGEPPAGLCRAFMTPGDELCEMVPGLTLKDGDACSGCRLAALGALRRARPPRLVRPLTVICGHWDGSTPAQGSVLVIGDCAAAAADLGSYVPGCPPDSETVRRALVESGALCQLCQGIARDALRALPPEGLADLRVTAAGDTVFAGPGVEATVRHRAIIVGDCSEAYAAIVRDRAPLLGMDPDRDVIYVPGCPVEAEAIRETIKHQTGPGRCTSRPVSTP
ncbi:MAG: DUF362 domain-containing protein [Anaerolineae bacterium]